MATSGGAGARRPAGQQVEVVRYWRLLELFSPQQVPAPDPGSAERPVLDWSPGRPLPWDLLAPPRAAHGKPREWRHTVYLGVYDVEAVYEHLHRVFPHDEDAHDERPSGRSACASIVVDASGRAVDDSAVLSSAVWGVGRTVDPGVDRSGWTDGFDQAQEQLVAAVAEHLAPSHRRTDEPDDERRGEAVASPERPRVDAGTVVELAGLAHAAAGVVGLDGIATLRVRVASTAVLREPGAGPPEQVQDFLNSLLLDDLRAVADPGSGWGRALHEYLTLAEDVLVTARVDVRAQPEAVVAGTRVERLPAGRWLSKPDEHLATSQQFAVNEAFSSLGGSSGLMAVNGPPGTGKTTMLRDVLAGNVVRRAEALAALDAPAAAFTTETPHRWKAGDYVRSVRTLRPEVTGFEMLLASSNNTAVQNVSDELPQRAAIHDPDETVDHFGALATEIADRQRSERKRAEDHSWGLVAARLGNSRNRDAFRAAFWFGRGPQGPEPEPGRDRVLGFQQILKNWEAAPRTRPPWPEARRSFEQARSRVQVLVDQRFEAQRRCERTRQVAAELAATERRAAELEVVIRATAERRRTAAARLPLLESAVRDHGQRRQRHRDGEPGWLEKILHRDSTREWRQELTALDDELTDAEVAVRAVHRELGECDASAAGARAERDECTTARSRLGALAADLALAVREDAETSGGAYPSREWSTDDVRREMHAAWLDRDLDQARSDLFLEALALHRAFWAGVPDLRKDLQASLDVVSGVAPRTVTEQARRAAWQLFFLVVPLVSTTFASVGRMLRGLGPGALGWLLVDEAGQAPPQAAVGAIWRAERVLVVGDPMQLTPVVTVPRHAQQDLAAALSVGDEWVPSTTSVQHLADRTGRYGMTLTNGPEPLWVGAPLRVHRRCSSPMFEVSNRIAYEGMMIDGTQGRADAVPALPPSVWFHVSATSSGSHLQRPEIDRLEALLRSLDGRGVAMSRVIAVSPFRAVAHALLDVRADHPGLVAGTIHTAQGKEADVVFLVLGGDPKRPGAKKWASAAPNLVNVAVSRARHRLYVIGDLAEWSRYPYFDELARALRPSRTEPSR